MVTKDIKELFRVDEINIGHDGDRSVGESNEYSVILLSDELAEQLYDNKTVDLFKKDLVELFQKYDDDCRTISDDVEEIVSAYCEEQTTATKKENLTRMKELSKKRNLDKKTRIELYLLKEKYD